MFEHSPTPAMKPLLTAVTLALSTLSLNAQATLTSYTSNGADLVYSSISDVTWTKDADLLGTWMAASTDANGNGILDLIDDIMVGNNIVGPRDFSRFGGGTVSIYGAFAFVSYLNRINYGGINNWYLPTMTNTTVGPATTNGNSQGDEMAELFYSELNGIVDSPFPNTTTFDFDLRSGLYWSGTGFVQDPRQAWYFGNGFQNTLSTNNKLYVWAISSGQVAAVPEPDSMALLLTVLGVLAGVVRRRQQEV